MIKIRTKNFFHNKRIISPTRSLGKDYNKKKAWELCYYSTEALDCLTLIISKAHAKRYIVHPERVYI